MGQPWAKSFPEEYIELFDREGEGPILRRIKSAQYGRVVRILSALRLTRHSGPNGQYLSGLEGQLVKEGAFDPTSLEDARERVLRAVIVRDCQPKFRAELLAAYGGRCAITECDAAPALEAAHVKPYEGVRTNVVKNGLLRRADIHTLFDLDLIGVDPSDGRAHISNQLENTVYRELEGTPLRPPNDASASPNRAALESRWNRFFTPGKAA